MTEPIALVTGGTKGTGKAIVLEFLKKSVRVVTNYRKDQKAADAFREEFSDQAVDVLQADLGDQAQVERLFDHIQSEYGQLNYFIANAAATAFKPLLETKPHHIEKTFAITVTAFVLGCQRSAKLMKDGGAIVAISGYDTHTYLPRHGVLGAAKSALETLVKYFSVELAPRNINVNAVNPGFLATTSTKIYMGDKYEQIKKANEALTPRGRVTDGRDIANVVLYLCSPEAEWICGQTIRADGGLSHLQPLALPEE